MGSKLNNKFQKFIFILDAVRKDHVSLYGYDRKTTPYIDKFAKNADIYQWAIAPAPYTLASVPSILSGKYPHEMSNKFTSGKFEAHDFKKIDNLRKKGVNAAFFTANIVTSSKNTNLNESFDYFYDENPDANINEAYLYQSASKVMEAVYDFVKRNKNRDFIAFVHLMEAHGPYVPDMQVIFNDDLLFKQDKRKISRVINDALTGVNAEDLVDQIAVPRYQLLETVEGPDGLEDFERSINYYIAKYDTGINYLDSQLGLFFDYLKKLGIYNASEIVITSDHGEFLGEENIYFSHGIMPHPAVALVPLIHKKPFQDKSKLMENSVSVKDFINYLDDGVWPETAGRVYSIHPKSFGFTSKQKYFLVHNGDLHHSETYKECLFPTKNFDIGEIYTNFEELNINIKEYVFSKGEVNFQKIISNKENGELIKAYLTLQRMNYTYIKDRAKWEIMKSEKVQDELRSVVSDSQKQLQLLSNQIKDLRKERASLKNRIRAFEQSKTFTYWRLYCKLRDRIWKK